MKKLIRKWLGVNDEELIALQVKIHLSDLLTNKKPLFFDYKENEPKYVKDFFLLKDDVGQFVKHEEFLDGIIERIKKKQLN